MNYKLSDKVVSYSLNATSSGIKDWSKTTSENSITPPYDFPEGMQPAMLNDGIRQNMAFIRQQWEDMWFDLGYKYTYVAINKFEIDGDKTADFPAGLRLKIKLATTNIYCDVIKSELRASKTEITVSTEELTDIISGVERGLPLDMYNKPVTELYESTFYSKGYSYKYENYYKVALTSGVFKSADWEDATKFASEYISDYEQEYTIFTQVSGKMFTKNSDGSDLAGVDSAKAWYLAYQIVALGGTVPAGKTYIELPAGITAFEASGAGAGGLETSPTNGGLREDTQNL